MALLHGGFTTDSRGNRIPYMIDTDDLDDKEYYYLNLAKKYIGTHKNAGRTYYDILNGRIDAYDIENNEKYDWLTHKSVGSLIKMYAEKYGNS